MEDLRRSLQEGHYARKQVFCKARLISWSHRRRLQIGLRLARQFAGKRVLDYGCGDGTFLALLMCESYAPIEAVGSELHRHTVEDCERRLGNSCLRFVDVDDLKGTGPFDGIFCMEVLEHVVDSGSVLDQLECLLAPLGKLLISIPVETGLPLVFKQAVRRMAGWRGLGDYPGIAPYTLGEYLAGIIAGPKQRIVRPVHHRDEGDMFPDHKGFNWMAFREMLAQRFEVERIQGSPVAWLPPHLGSQVWFVLRRKAKT